MRQGSKYEPGNERLDEGKEFAEITVTAGTFGLYEADGWERVFEDDKLLVIRRRIGGER